MASYVKVFIQWDHRWWAREEYSTHVVLIDEGEDNAKWRLVSELSSRNESLQDTPQARTLCLTSIGDEAKRVLALTDEEISKEIHAKLRRAYRHLTVPDAKAIFVPRWDSNPLFLGTFQRCEVGCNILFDENLRKPIDLANGTKIWFAGEAYHERYSGFMTGAYLSGKQVAKELIAEL